MTQPQMLRQTTNQGKFYFVKTSQGLLIIKNNGSVRACFKYYFAMFFFMNIFPNRGKEAKTAKTEASTTQTSKEENIITVQSPKNTDQLKVKGQFYW